MRDPSTSELECDGYCGKLGHHEEECWKKMRESASTSRQLTNYAHNFDYEDYNGMYGHNSNYEDRGGMYARCHDMARLEPMTLCDMGRALDH